MTKKRKGREKRRIEERQEDQTQCLLSPGDSKLSSTDKVSSSLELCSLVSIFFTFNQIGSLFLLLDHQLSWRLLSGPHPSSPSSSLQLAGLLSEADNHCSLTGNDFPLNLQTFSQPCLFAFVSVG